MNLTKKTGELALYYNLAFNRVCQFLYNTADATDRKALDDAAGKDYEADAIRYFLFKKPGNVEHREGKIYTRFDRKLFSERVYGRFKELVLKEKSGGKGGKINDITQHDILRINKILAFLLRVRDMHSHYYHENTIGSIDLEIKKFLDDKLEIAKASYPYANPGEAMPFNLYTENAGTSTEGRPWKSYSLTAHGVNFFLSFFLTRSMMMQFMGQREGLKRSKAGKNAEGKEVDFDYHRFLCTYYSARDGYAQHVFLEKRELPDFKLPDYLALHIEAHLQGLPYLLQPLLKTEHLTDAAWKHPNNYLKMLVYWFSMDAGEDIAWEIFSDIREEKAMQRPPQKKQHGKGNNPDKNKIPDSYVRKVKQFETHPGTTPEPLVKNHQIRIRITHKNGDTTILQVHEHTLTYLAHLRLSSTENYRKAVDHIRKFADDYRDFLNGLTLQKPILPELLHKYLYTERKDPMIPEVLKKLYEHKNESKEEWIAGTRKNIRKKIEHLLHLLEVPSANDKESPAELIGIPTEVYKTSQKIKNLHHKPGKKKEEWTEEEKQEFEFWLNERRKYKRIRHRKMQIILKLLPIVLESRGRFITQEQQKNFCRYCYLADARDESQKKLIGDWLFQLNRIPKPKFKGDVVKSNPNENFKQKFLSLQEGAESFDKLYKDFLALTIEKLRFIHQHIDKQAEQTVNYWARKLHITNSSPEHSRNTDPTTGSRKAKKNEHIKNRKEEILEPYHPKGSQRYYGHLPPYFLKLEFPHWFQPSEASNAKTALSAINEQPFYQHQKNKWKEKVRPEETGIFLPILELMAQKKEQKQHLSPAKKLHTLLIQDYILSEIRKSILTEGQNNWKYTNDGNLHWEINTEPSIIITCKPREIRTNDAYLQGSRIKGIIQRLRDQEPERTEFTLYELKQAVKDEWHASLPFLEECIILDEYAFKGNYEIEKLNNYTTKKENLSASQLNHKNFRNVLAQIQKLYKDKGIDVPPILSGFKLNNIRNNAFHGNILPPKQSYEEFKNEVESIVGQLKTWLQHP